MQLPRWLLILILALIPLAFLINLGLQPFIDDEGNRATVALEMIWSGNFITPTLHGDYYYNKPPLWNWILALSMWVHGYASEWTARFPAVLALFGFAATVFYYCRKHFSLDRSALAAFIFLTSGRIIFWESLLGMIDLAFSWAIFTIIMVFYHESEEKRWGRMFLFTYLLMAIGFLFKGLPAIAFQGLTLLLTLQFRKAWRQLFSLSHVGSGLLAVGIIAAYYAVYNQYHSLETVFQVLFVESGKRTAVAYGWWDTVKHMLSFPLELFYHFLPWTAFVLLLFNKNYRQQAWASSFVRYCLYALGINIIIYWLSPNFYPRYILMLLPLGLIALVQMIPDREQDKNKLYKAIEILFGIVLFGIVVISAGTAVVEATQTVTYRWLKAISVALFILFLLFQYYRSAQSRWFYVVAAILVFRIGFDMMALPPRTSTSSIGQGVKTSAIELAERWQSKQLLVFAETQMEPTSSFYLQNRLQRMVPRRKVDELTTEEHYLFSPDQYDRTLFHTPIDSMKVRHSISPYYYVARLKTTDPEEIKERTLRPPAGF